MFELLKDNFSAAVLASLYVQRKAAPDDTEPEILNTQHSGDRWSFVFSVIHQVPEDTRVFRYIASASSADKWAVLVKLMDGLSQEPKAVERTMFEFNRALRKYRCANKLAVETAVLAFLDYGKARLGERIVFPQRSGGALRVEIVPGPALTAKALRNESIQLLYEYNSPGVAKSVPLNTTRTTLTQLIRDLHADSCRVKALV